VEEGQELGVKEAFENMVRAANSLNNLNLGNARLLMASIEVVAKALGYTVSSKVNWEVKPVDDMDALFKQHDQRYQTEGYSREHADAILMDQLELHNPKGLWPNIYKQGAIIAFTVKRLGYILSRED